MSKKKTVVIVIGVVFAFIAIMWLIGYMSYSPLKKEIYHYQLNGYDIYNVSMRKFYDNFSYRPLREVEVSRLELRRRAQETYEFIGKKDLYTNGERLWTVWIPRGGSTCEVSVWKWWME